MRNEENQQHELTAPSPQNSNHPIKKTQKKPSIKSLFASFMAGAIVVGGLMFASDRLNLFGDIANPLSNGTSTAATEGVQTASLNISGSGSVSDIAKQASPAVVKIETKVKASNNRSSNPLSNSPFFQQFMGDNNSGSQSQQEGSSSLQESGLGSGFIFESSGYILTNEHVIDGAEEIDVYVQGYDEPFKATLLGSSYDLDLAVLKIKGDQDFPYLTIGNSDNAQVGDWVVAIGNPYDYDYTVTAGVLSAKDRPINIEDEQGTRNYQHLIQTDTAINPGNSGGPLLSLNGEVIGINTAVSAEAQGIGFAIPTSTINSVLDKLKNNESIPKEASPYIGVSLQDISEDMLGDLKLNSTDGAFVADVQQKSPAFQAGIRPYDVIVAANGATISSPEELTKSIQAAKVGDSLKLTISRDGQTLDITVTIGDKNNTGNARQ